MLIPVGAVIDERYEILELVAEGGMGRVFRAKERGLNRQVAIKILHATMVGDEETRERFRREGKILSSLSHPNVVVFYRFGLWKNSYPYICMEYLQGKSLRSVLSEGATYSVKKTLNILIEICSGMQSAHDAGVVHRDLKPNNIMLLPDGNTERVKIVDFGLARLAGPEAQHLTQTGALVGSVYYMSPEQCSGRPADARSDIYSLGCVMYELFTGTYAFSADNPVGLMHKHSVEPPPSLHTHWKLSEPIPEGLNEVIQKCLAKPPSDRYASMSLLAEDLLLVLEGEGRALTATRRTGQVPISARSPLLIASAAVAAVVGVYFGFQVSTPKRTAAPYIVTNTRTARITDASSFARRSFYDQIGDAKNAKESLAISRLFLAQLPRNMRKIDFKTGPCTYAISNVCCDLRLQNKTDEAVRQASIVVDLGERLQDIAGAKFVESLRLWKARCLIWNGNYDDADAIFQKALSRSSSRDMVQIIASAGAAECMIESGKLDEAQKTLLHLRKTTNDGPCEASIALNLAKIEAKRKNYSAVISYLAEAIKGDTASFAVAQQAAHLYDIAEVFSLSGSKKYAAHYLRCARDLEVGYKPEKIVDQLTLLLQDNKPANVFMTPPSAATTRAISRGEESPADMKACADYIAQCQSVTARQVDHLKVAQIAGALAERPMMLRTPSDFALVESCIAVLEGSSGRVDSLIECLNAKASMLKDEGKPSEALKVAERARVEVSNIGLTNTFTYYPLNFDSFYKTQALYSTCLLKLGQIDRAISVLTSIESDDLDIPWQRSIRLNLAELLIAKNDFKSAEKKLISITEHKTHKFMCTEAWLALAALYEKQGAFEKALNALQQAKIEPAPPQIYRIYLLEASVYQELKETDKVTAALEQARETSKLSLVPQRIFVLQTLANHYRALKQQDKAGDVQKEVEQLRRQFPPVSVEAVTAK